MTRFVSCIGEWLLTIGGALALAVSVGIFVSLIVRPTASINPFNMATLVLASAGGIVATLYPSRPRVLMAANVLLLLAVVPTVFAWIWLLYVPSVIFMATGTFWKVLHSRTSLR